MVKFILVVVNNTLSSFVNVDTRVMYILGCRLLTILVNFADVKNGELSVQANVLAASCAGIATAIATNPLWVVKTRLQVCILH